MKYIQNTSYFIRFINLISEKTKIIVAFWVSIVILLCLGIYTFTRMVTFKNKVEDVSNSAVVINKVQETLNALQDIETTYKDFKLSGDSLLLQTIDVNRRIFRLRVADIEKLKLSHPEKLLADSIVRLSNFEITPDAIGSMPSFENKKLKYIITSFLSYQKNRHDRLQKEENDIFWNNIWLIVFSFITSLILFSVTTFYVLRVYMRLTQAKAMLQNSRTVLESILEEMPIGVVNVNARSNRYHINKKGSLLLEGIAVDGVVNDYNDELFQKLFITNARHGEKNIGVDSGIVINGKEILLKVSAIPLYDEDQKMIYCTCVFDDVTNIKRAESELIRAKKLSEDSLRLKDVFLANMSHEIRTPMNAILGFTELLSKSDLGEDENEYVSIIRTAGDNLLRIINDILDFSKLNANMMIFEQQATNVKDELEAIVNLFQHKAREKNISLYYTHGEDIPIVITDSVRLAQVITNIVGNGIKFTEKGWIKISTSKIAETHDEVTIRFEIEDTGIGIEEDKINKIFARFEQGGGSRTYGGSGLGLSIAKHIVETFGGKLSVRSSVGQGSVFSFYIPFKKHGEEKKAVTVTNISETLHEKEIRILLVEDNPFNVKLIGSIFSNYYVKLSIAENGRSAIEQLTKNQFDIILLDIELPDITGYEIATTIRLKGVNTPIIALTAHAMAGEKEKCMAVGMNDYLSKPINTEILFKKISQLTRSRIVNRENIIEAHNEVNGDLISLEYLESISGNNKDFEAEILNEFILHTGSKLTALEEALKTRNYKELKQILHSLKSMVTIVFKKDLLPEIEQLEHEINREDIDASHFEQANVLIVTIRKGMAEVRELLATHYSVLA